MDEVSLIGIAVAAAVMVLAESENKPAIQGGIPVKKRRGKTREWIKRRSRKGVFQNLLKELELEDAASYKNWMRMSHDTFNELLHLLQFDLKKQTTVMQETISPAERLALTIKYFATGASFQQLEYDFRISQRAISQIIIETARAIYKKLRQQFFNLPTDEPGWKLLAHNYNVRCNFPTCIGAIDGKHITMLKPKNSGSHYFNYKKTYSIVLMAVVDSNLQFLYVDVGTNGRISDGGVWNKCSFHEKLVNSDLHIPPPVSMDGIAIPMPYVFVADDAFMLKPNVMKPYKNRGLTVEEEVFNYRLSRARRCVECAFGVMANRFRVLLNPVAVEPPKVRHITLAICALHNFLLKRSAKSYCSPGLSDEVNATTGEVRPGRWRNDDHSYSMLNLQNRPANVTNDAKGVRNILKNYFSSDQGSVPWQLDAIRK